MFEVKLIDEKTKNKTNATKRSSIAEHFINNTNCANNYDSTIFKTLDICTHYIDLVRIEEM